MAATFPVWAWWVIWGLMTVLAGFVVYCMWLPFSTLFRKKPVIAPPPSSAAMELASMVGTLLPVPPVYRYEDFLEDLKNPGVSIDTVLARCGGRIPAEWELRLGPAPARATPGQIELPVVADETRTKARLEWFNKASEKTFLLKVVPPPLSPPPVPMIKAWVVHCKFCAPNNGAYLPPPDRYNPIRSCRWCKGTGFVTITGG